VLLNLQGMFRAAYEPAFYDRRLRYDQPLEPPLRATDEPWGSGCCRHTTVGLSSEHPISIAMETIMDRVRTAIAVIVCACAVGHFRHLALAQDGVRPEEAWVGAAEGAITEQGAPGTYSVFGG